MIPAAGGERTHFGTFPLRKKEEINVSVSFKKGGKDGGQKK